MDIDISGLNVEIVKACRNTILERKIQICEPPHWVCISHEWDQERKFKRTYEDTVAYMAQLKQYTKLLEDALAERDKALQKCDIVLERLQPTVTITEVVEKRKEPEPPAISVIETPVLKKPAPTMMKK